MALVRYYLLSLKRSVSVANIRERLKKEEISPLAIARPVQWVHLPMKADYMLAVDWDMALVLDSNIRLPQNVAEATDAIHMVDVHVASPVPSNESIVFGQEVSATSSDNRTLRALCTQFHQITPSLLALVDHPLCPKGPISMLNFVSYHPGPTAAESYKKYLGGVQAGPGKKYGVHVKYSGSATPSDGSKVAGDWDLVFMAVYPSFRHFVDMGSDPDYQVLNQKYRMPALRDLCILMTTEVDLEWTISESEKVKPEISDIKVP